jgi:hypothetical protein
MPGPGHGFTREQLEVLEAHAAWGRAEARHDQDAIREILDPQFVATICVHGKVRVFDRESFLDMAVSGIALNGYHEHTDFNVIIDGDTAASMITELVYRSRNGVETCDAYRITATFIRRAGKWRCLFEQLAAIDCPATS